MIVLKRDAHYFLLTGMIAPFPMETRAARTTEKCNLHGYGWDKFRCDYAVPVV